MANVLRNFRILIADSDVELARVLRATLVEMGFENIQTTRSGSEAFKMIQTEGIDFLITDWNTQMDGTHLVDQIRRNPESNKPTLPVIMLTGRAEQSDVIAARDSGVNEYVVKPFSPKSIYNRLERLIEKPRAFVVAPNFVGPCRRHDGMPPVGVADRRKTVIIPKLQPQDVSRAVQNNTGVAKVWLPDFSLKYKLGVSVSLKSLITPEVLNAAQAAIDAIADESLQWVKGDLQHLRSLCDLLKSKEPPSNVASEIGELALSINSRAGTFGYTRAAEIAYMLYLFSRNQMQPPSKGHHIVVEKHIEVLQVILGSNLKGDAGAMGAQIVAELRLLTQKNK